MGNICCKCLKSSSNDDVTDASSKNKNKSKTHNGSKYAVGTDNAAFADGGGARRKEGGEFSDIGSAYVDADGNVIHMPEGEVNERPVDVPGAIRPKSNVVEAEVTQTRASDNHHNNNTKQEVVELKRNDVMAYQKRDVTDGGDVQIHVAPSQERDDVTNSSNVDVKRARRSSRSTSSKSSTSRSSDAGVTHDDDVELSFKRDSKELSLLEMMEQEGIVNPSFRHDENDVTTDVRNAAPTHAE